MKERGKWAKTRRVKTPAPPRPELDKLVKTTINTPSAEAFKEHQQNFTQQEFDLALKKHPHKVSMGPKPNMDKLFETKGPQPAVQALTMQAKLRPSELSAPMPLQPGLLDSGQMMASMLSRVTELTTLYLSGVLKSKLYVERLVALQDSPEWRVALLTWETARRSQERKAPRSTGKQS